MFEENFLRLKYAIDSNNETFSMQIKICRWLGDVSLILSLKGETFNPVSNIEAELNFED